MWTCSRQTRRACSPPPHMCLSGVPNARRPVAPRQVARAAGALALAPLARRLLDSVQARLRLRTRRAAFLCVLGACLLAALCVFGCVAATFV